MSTFPLYAYVCGLQVSEYVLCHFTVFETNETLKPIIAFKSVRHAVTRYTV